MTSIVDSVNLASRTGLPAGIDGTGTSAANYAAGATGQLYAGVSDAANSATDPDGDGNATTYAGTYANYACLTPTSAGSSQSVVATIPGSTTSGNYGAEKKLIIRVWLDGEDGECWNDNAGQDWAISLRFSKLS
ncbi:MAG: hypothetical protein IIY78_00675 [Clostridia bacterium]|nr:hypothetical protein [Clostridia bacterium]